MRWTFGEFTLDTESRQLHHASGERRLSPKAFELLSLLVDARPRALSKPELHARLWTETFVSDSTLSSVVAELRNVLGDSAITPRYVRTFHRFGYAFIGDARGADSSTPTPALAQCWLLWASGQMAIRDGTHLLGRDRDVSVWLESPTVSRHHARLHVAGAQATLEDLGSKNGTYVCGQRLTTCRDLSDGNEVRLGSFAMTFRIVAAAGSTVSVGPDAAATRPAGRHAIRR